MKKKTYNLPIFLFLILSMIIFPTIINAGNVDINASEYLDKVFPFTYGGGAFEIGSGGWNHITKSFDFPCSGAADLQGTPCAGKVPEAKGEFSVPGPYSLVSFYYSCKTYNYEGGCSYGKDCTIKYSGQDDTTSVQIEGDAKSMISSKPNEAFYAYLMKGSVTGKYQCNTCGHGEYVYYVQPTKCNVSIYTKSFGSCDAFCKEALSNSIGKEEKGACNCYCKGGYKKKQLTNKVWACQMEDFITGNFTQKDFIDCNSAVVTLQIMNPGVFGGSYKGKSYEWSPPERPLITTDAPDVVGMESDFGLTGNANKWVKSSGCLGSTAIPDLTLCLSRYCTDVVGASLKAAGGTLPGEQATIKFKEMLGSIIEKLTPNTVKLNKGEVYVKTVHSSAGVKLPNGAVVFHSEGTVSVDENGTATIYLFSGNATYITMNGSDVLYVNIYAGEKLSTDAQGKPKKIEQLDKEKLDKWWEQEEQPFCAPTAIIGFLIFSLLSIRKQFF